MNLSARSIVKILFVVLAVISLNTPFAHSSASVSLRWDANVPAPEGYRVFAREAGGSYDYDHPIWEKSLTTCTLTGLTEGVTYFFVVRAYEGDLESVDSDEVSYTPPLVDTEPDSVTGTDNSSDTDNEPTNSQSEADIDSDGDNVVDSQDLFPSDPAEWADNDHDGIGNNLDADDDNDGMTDAWEAAHGLEPLIDDAELDADGDGVTNLDEFLGSTESAAASANNAPEAPVIENTFADERVSLTPVLLCGEYFDSDNDDHYQSRWQISTETDFSPLIVEATSTTQLYTYAVGDMVLDADTVYYWRVQFIDAENQASNWSETATFTTITVENAGDADLDGIIDDQAADQSIDVNHNGIADALENNIMTINTVEGDTIVGVETLSDKVTLVSIKSLSADSIDDSSIDLGFGLVGFKLYLQDGVTSASVTMHFSKRVPKNAKLYKYTIENGWRPYDNAVFAANRKSVTVALEDGGLGDEDGVENGVIVDPSGIAYQVDSEITSDSASVSTTDASAGGSGGTTSCFITTGTAEWSNMNAMHSTIAVAMIFMLLTVGCVFCKSPSSQKIE